MADVGLFFFGFADSVLRGGILVGRGSTWVVGLDGHIH